MKIKLLALGLVAATALSAQAQGEQARWLRGTALSPDGKTVAFTYKGDIYTVGIGGGEARQLTSNKAYDSAPVWTPDGKSIVFSSDRLGSDDIFMISSKGGTAKRLTTHAGSETPLTFLDNNTLLFSANLMPAKESIQGPFQAQMYTIDVTKDSPRPVMYASTGVKSASANKAGQILYADKKGFENIWRKHERSSATSDIWLIEKDKYTKLTNFNGHSLNPLWTADGKGFVYISEEDGTLNVYSRNLDGTNKKQLTKYKEHPVRDLTMSPDGTIAYSWNGDLYTMAPGQSAKKLNVTVNADDFDADIVKNYINNFGARSMAISPDGEQIAFVLRGDIYVTSPKYKTTKRITDTPAQERYMSFTPDGRTLVYDSDRDGVWQLFKTTIKNPDEKTFTYVTDLVEEPLYKCATSAQQPDVSPDGKKVAFLEDRTTLRVIDLKTKKVNTALDGKYNYSYTDGDISFNWSPDSRWLLADYIGVGGWNNSDIALVKADGSEVVDLTESGYADSNPQWVLGGKGITYSTGKYGMKSHGSWGNQADVVLMMLDGDAWDEFNMTEEEAELAKKAKDDKKKEDDKAKADKDKDKKDKKGDKDKKDDKKDGDKADKKDEVKPLEFDLDNRIYRTAKLTPVSSSLGDNYLDPKGEKFYYVAGSTEGKYNLMVRDMKKGDTKVLAQGVSGGLIADKEGKNLFVITGSGIKKVALPSGETKAVEFEAPYHRHPSLEREYIYDHAWKQVKDKFYDKNIHGIDWAGYGKNYRQFLPYINNNRDFAVLLSELLGELNASHTGARSYGTGGYMTTGELGAYFDENYKGDGLKVAEVLNRGALSKKKFDVKPGDIIMSIDGQKIEAGKDFFPLLEGKAGKKTRVEVKKANGETKFIDIKPDYQGTASSLLYNRWVERNQHLVDSLSNGRLAYVHVQGMNSPSFRTVYSQLLGKYRNREAVIVDTRWNGGGWLHNDIAVLLNGKEYVRFTPRGRYIGSEPFSQWTKPSVMLVNESNYSDAHGTPFTYQALGIGDVIGAPVPGTMTAVWWETQIDPTLVFGIPQVTSQDMQGNVLENHQLTPDVEVYNNPGDVVKGNDQQIKTAVNHLLKKLDAKK